MNSYFLRSATTVAILLLMSSRIYAAEDLNRALKRAQYLLNGTVPTDADFTTSAATVGTYQTAVRNFIEHGNFYNVLLRYHERVFGVGLKQEYLEELLREEIDDKQHKFASIICERGEERYRCSWSDDDTYTVSSSCSAAEETAVSVFWYPGIVAWVCPSIVLSCGSDLSRCFVEYTDSDAARNSELGATEIFDSRYAVIKSLARQSAGLATAVAVENYPYTKILEPGLTAIDGAIAHFYRQNHHFRIAELNVGSSVLNIADSASLEDTRYRLVYTGNTYESAGVLTTFGWLRRYDKHRTRANQLYERLLCRKFTSELPRVFPQDPGNLRETPGCSGCHATLDPLADFFAVWGEGGNFYQGQNSVVSTYFNNQTGSYLSELSSIITADRAFATCQVQHVWEWLIARKFYRDESTLRDALTDYIIATGYSFKELVYAVATHPVFLEGTRSDAVVVDPLEEPPLGTEAGSTQQECTTTIDYTTDIAPSISYCTPCHNSSSDSRQDLSTESQWQIWGNQSVNMMSSGVMPPGLSGPEILEFKEKVRCWMEQNG